MFYEMNENRLKKASQTRWWLTAAFSAFIITALFIGMSFWLGSNARQEIILERTFEEYDNEPAEQRAPPARLPKLEYPSAEILKTTIKNKKAKIEVVDPSSGETSGTSFSSSSSRRSAESRPTNRPTSPRMKFAKENIPAEFSTFPEKHTLITDKPRFSDTRTGFLESRVPTRFSESPTYYTEKAEFASSSPEEWLEFRNSRSDFIPSSSGRYETFQLSDGVDKVSESSISRLLSRDMVFEEETVMPSTVTKKSEALPPSWFDSRLESSDSSSPEPANLLNENSGYDVSDFSSIKPDLSAFNVKTIPAFTYLKDPIPEIRDLPDRAPENESNSYYYEPDVDSKNGQEEEDEENALSTILERRAHDFQNWILQRTKRNHSGVDFGRILKSLNNSLHSRGASMMVSKIKQLYNNLNATQIQNLPVASLLYPSSPALFNNTTSLVSFGLLAIDLFLLHNVQQIVWNEENNIGEDMLKDPDVLALNALFLPPDRIQELKDPNARVFTNRENKGALHELMEFLNGGVRAVMNLSKAYKSSTNSRARSTRDGDANTIDCIWTLYCRNLDKTAKLRGPYGFLAKMNSLGLRLMMGEFPPNKAFEKLMKEFNGGWASLNCDQLFPRCSAEKAKEVVIQTALGGKQN